MALQVWLPLNGNLKNKGCSDITVTNNGATVDNNGKIGQCYSFDGSDDFISIGGNILYSTFKGGSQPFSIAFWVYHNDSSRAILLGDYQLSGAINFNIELTTAHTFRFYWAGSPDKTFTGSSVGANTWTHVCVTYDGSKIITYINGVALTDVYSGTLATKSKTSGVYYLGRDSRTGATALNGKLNDFRIYNHCLSVVEVKELSRGLALHYKLDDITDIIDSSGYGHHGSIGSGTISIASNSPRHNTYTDFHNGYVIIPWCQNLNQDFTVNLWVNVDKSEANKFFVTGRDVVSNRTFNFGINGTTQMQGLVFTPPNGYYGIQNGTVPTGTHMYTLVHNNGTLSIYKDGVLFQTQNQNNTVYGNSAPTVSNIYISQSFIKSDLRIYCTALSVDDILELYRVSTKIDNKKNVHCYTLLEHDTSDNTKLFKTGVFRAKEFNEINNTMKIKEDKNVDSNQLIEM